MIKGVGERILASEPHMLAILESVTVFVAVMSPDGTLTAMRGEALNVTGLPADALVGQPFADVPLWSYSPDVQAQLRAAIARAQAGVSSRYDVKVNMHGGQLTDIDFTLCPMFHDTGEVTCLVASAIDITGRKQAEHNAAFLASISLDLVRLTGRDEIMQIIAPKLGEHLGLSRCVFAEIDEAAEQAIVVYDWHRDNVSGLTGAYRLAEYLTDDFQQAGRAGEAFVVHDTTVDQRCDANGYTALEIGSFVTVPLIQDGQ